MDFDCRLELGGYGPEPREVALDTVQINGGFAACEGRLRTLQYLVLNPGFAIIRLAIVGVSSECHGSLAAWWRAKVCCQQGDE